MTAILKVSNVTKTYQGKPVVDHLNFSLKEGEIVGLVGPNGAGKTTLMRIIMGLIINYKGDVQMNPLHTTTTSNARTGRVGCMIEAPSFYPNLSGLDNLKYFAEVSGGYDKTNVDEIIELMGLERFVKKKVSHYSLGMKQRLGIAQALLNQPEVLILDEPTNGLDPNGVYEIRQLIKTVVQKQSISVLISSHILSEIETICDRVLFMEKGKLIKDIDLNDNENQPSSSAFIIKSAEPEKVAAFIKQTGDSNIIDSNEQFVSFTYESAHIETLIRSLVYKDIRFHAIYEDKKSLEQQFFDILGGNQIE